MPVRALIALLACLVLLPACDSGGDNPGGGDLDGYTGAARLLGVWEFDGEDGIFAIISYDSASRQTEATGWFDDGACWDTEGSERLLDLTTTSFREGGTVFTYTATSTTLTLTGSGEPFTYTRSSRDADSFTPEC